MAAFMRSGNKSFIRALKCVGKVPCLFSAPPQQTVAMPLLHRFVSSEARYKIMNDVHRRIDYNQGISFSLFKSLMSTLEQSPLTEQDMGLLLHICSMGPFDCSIDRRISHIDDIWSKMDRNDITPSTKLYNIKLKAYCRNNKDFNPLDELVNMKSLGMNPDKVTYIHLIEAFCLKGDIDGANSVLEAMKTDNIAINIRVFSSFITGHLKAGSLEEANKVMDMISSSGLKPNSHTYFRFASHFAEQGDMASITKYMEEAEAADVPFDHHMLLDLYKVMASSGHAEAAKQLLDVLSEKGVFSMSYMEQACNLVSEGHLDPALQLYAMMPAPEESKVASNSGNFLLKCMIVNDYSAQELFNMADKIVELSPKALFAHRNALQFAYRAGKTDIAVEFLDLMIAKNHKIKVPYIIPAICSYRDAKNVEGVYKMTEILLGLPTKITRDDKYDQLVRIALPALLQCQQTQEDIVTRLQKYEGVWNSIFFLEDINLSGFDVAISNAEGKKLDGWVFKWSDAPNIFFKHLPKDIVSCVKALEFIKQVDEENYIFLSSKVVRYVISMKDWEIVDNMLDAFIEKELYLVQNLTQMMSLSEAPDHIKEKMEKLCDNQRNTYVQRPRRGQYLPQAQIKEMSEEDVRKYIKKNPDSFFPRQVLLEKVLETGDLDSIKQTLRELQAMGFHLTLIPTMKVITKLIHLKDTETAIVYFEELKKLMGVSYKPTIPLMIAEELLKQGDMQGCIEMIEGAKASKHQQDIKTKMVTRSMLISILDTAPTHEDLTRLHTAMFKDASICEENEAKIIHGAYIKRLVNFVSDEVVVETLLKLYQNYSVFPVHDFVLERLISRKDVANLKKVMDLGNMAFGNDYFHHKLAVNFLRCGMPDRGATIFKTPGLKLNERILSSICRYLIKDKEFSTLQSLVTVLKDMPVSQGNMLNFLVEGLLQQGDLKQATEAVQQFAEDYKDPPTIAVKQLVQAYSHRGEELPEQINILYSNLRNTKRSQAESDSSTSSSDSDEPTNQSVESRDEPTNQSVESRDEPTNQSVAADEPTNQSVAADEPANQSVESTESVPTEPVSKS